MFTGLIETTGTVVDLNPNKNRLSIDIPFSQELNLGDSVAVNGCCLTVASLDKYVGFDLLEETLSRTNLGNLRNGEWVNLERALRFNQRLAGHLVQGHVDGMGKVLDCSSSGTYCQLTIKNSPKLVTYCFNQGSVTVNGISLTITEMTSDDHLIFQIIPHTYQVTNLHQINVGDFVNLEADIIAKYVEKLMTRSHK